MNDLDVSRFHQAVVLAGRRLHRRRLALAWLGALAALGALAGLGALSAGCASARSITAGAACSTLIVAIGEARQLAPERAVADIRTVSAVCRRLQDSPDAGVVDGGAQ